MRPNSNKWHSIFRGSGYSSPLLSYGALYALAALELLVMFRFCPYGIFTPDSYTYVDASNSIILGEVHAARTPVLPLVIALMRGIAGSAWQATALVIFQSLMFFVSVGVFRKIASKLIHSERGVFWATAVYALWPAFPGMALFVLTESLTTTGVVFLIWILLRRLPDVPRVCDAFWSGLMLILLVFLRPQMLCLTPAYVIYWCVIAVKHKGVSLRATGVGVLMLAVCGGALVAYKAEVGRRYGIKSLTKVSNPNNYYLLRSSGLLTPEIADNPRLKHFLDSVQDIDFYAGGEIDWDEYRYVRDSCGMTAPEIERTLEKARNSNPLRLSRGIMRQLSTASRTNMFFYPQVPFVGYLFVFLPVTLWFYMAFMCVAAVWLIARRKGLALWLLWLVSAAISGSAIVGAMWEWARLSAPGMPEALILAAAILTPAYQAWKRGRVLG